MTNSQQTEPTTWRDKWWAKYVLAEIPIVGGFFSKKSRNEALHDAGKCVATLVCSTASMMTVMQRDDPFLLASLKMLGSMAIGTTSGKVIYNGAYNGGALLYQYLSRPTHSLLPTDIGLEEEANPHSHLEKHVSRIS